MWLLARLRFILYAATRIARPVLLMRVALYGSVVLLALGVYALRAGRAPEEAYGSSTATTALNGATDEDFKTRMVVDDGVIIRLALTWRMRCERPGPEPAAYGIFGALDGDVIERDGDRFSVGGTAEEHRGGGVSVRYDTDVSGTLRGTYAHGRGRMATTWLVDGRVVNRCRSRDVRWRVGHGPAGGAVES